MAQYGYARVSTRDQHIDRQVTALINAGIDEKNIFIDKFSGRDFERPQYKKLLKKLKEGDVLKIQSLDRFGRNYEENVEQWRIITTKICADIIVLDMPLLDTTKYRDLLGTLIRDLILQVMSYAAQSLRETLLSNQAEGIVEAKKRGVKFGRPPKERPESFDEVQEVWKRREISASEAARRLDVDPKTFLKWVER